MEFIVQPLWQNYKEMNTYIEKIWADFVQLVAGMDMKYLMILESLLKISLWMT